MTYNPFSPQPKFLPATIGKLHTLKMGKINLSSIVKSLKPWFKTQGSDFCYNPQEIFQKPRKCSLEHS